MEAVGLYLWIDRSAILVLLCVAIATVGDFCIVLPIHIFMGAWIQE